MVDRDRSRSPRECANKALLECRLGQDAKRDSAEGPDIRFGPGGFDFTAPDPMPRKAAQRIMELMDSGRLFRYQGSADDVAELEREFSKYIGLPHTMACNSGGCGLFLALKALGVKPGDKVLLNAWTLAPVPGAVVHACASPIFVDLDRESLAIDIKDLEAKAIESGAKVLLLSYMRGQVPNMDVLLDTVKRLGLMVIEDCAHTLGATWKLDGDDTYRHLGSFGEVGVWSLQTNKSINCGEGGLISTRRQDIASYITIATGSYGHFQMNGSSGDPEHLQNIYTSVPNMSMRMTTIAAALARPQLEAMACKLQCFAQNAAILRNALDRCPHTRIMRKDSSRSKKEMVVWSSIQFELKDFTEPMIDQVIAKLASVGVPLAWFGGRWNGFTSTLKDWKFADPAGEQLKENYSATIQNLVDLPLYHTASWPDGVVERLAELLVDAITEVAQSTL